jgi:hypothetical protein
VFVESHQPETQETKKIHQLKRHAMVASLVREPLFVVMVSKGNRYSF